MILEARPLDDSFAPFGDIIEAAGPPDRLINAGTCGRWHDRARLDFGQDGRAGLSVFEAQPVALPLRLDLVERHPDGSQAFLPLSAGTFLVVVAEGTGAKPGRLRAYATRSGQGVNLLRGVWHGVLAPLDAPGLFAVIDRIGPTPNLDEHRLARPVEIVRP